MRSFCQLAILALPLFSTAAAASPDKQADHSKTIYATAQEAFQDLLNALPEESLQAALSGLKDFRIGVFESYHRGVEHVHNKNPALATKLIVDAVKDLQKRQASSANGTSTAPEVTSSPQTSDAPSPSTSEVAPPAQTTVTQTQQQETTVTQIETQQPSNDAPPPQTVTNTQLETTTVLQTATQDRPVIIPVETTIVQDGTTLIRTTQVLSKVTASIPITLTLTNQQGQTVTQTENRPAVIFTTTDSAGRTTVTTSAAKYAPTAGQVHTETDDAGSTFVTTYTPGGGLVSSIKLITTTDAQGRPTTMTSFTFVDLVQPTPTVGGGGDEATVTPSLQTGAAAAAIHNGVGAVAVGLGALALLV